MWLPWQPAAALAVVLGAAGVAARSSTRRHAVGAGAFLRELALVLALYSLWQVAGSQSVVHADGALAHARDLWRAEQDLHLPSEVAAQHLVLGHPLVVQACNLYYAIAHVPALVACLLWLFVRHRDRYPAVRNVLAVATGAALFVQLVPVAPPRMLPGLGFVDTAAIYGQSVYGHLAGADQLSAMPSVHVVWAVLVAVAVARATTSPWRWVAVAHGGVTCFVVVVTANHFWLDGVAGVALLGLGVAVQRGATALVAARRVGRPLAPPAPLDVSVSAR